MASILLFAMVNHINPALGKSYESEIPGVGIRPQRLGTPTPSMEALLHS